MSHRLSGKAAAPAMRSDTAKLPQKSAVVGPASIAPGMTIMMRLSMNSMRDRSRIGRKGKRERGLQAEPCPEQWQHRQRVAEEEREHNREHDCRPGAEPQAGSDHHPENFANRATRQTVHRRAERRPVQRTPLGMRRSCVSSSRCRDARTVSMPAVVAVVAVRLHPLVPWLFWYLVGVAVKPQKP
jgi:hypothetical protein